MPVIALASKPFINGDREANLQTMLASLTEAAALGADMLCFGEAFLQGFDGLCWDYAVDRDRAVGQTDETIKRLTEASAAAGVDLAFGYIERDGEALYSSYMALGGGGMIHNYRRVSRGWKEYTRTDDHYREGEQIGLFDWRGLRLGVALCGDLWEFPERFALGADALLWPVYCDYSIQEWMNGTMDEYALQCRAAAPVTLMINSICPPTGHGGCAAFRAGKTELLLPPGREGLLLVPLDSPMKG